MDPKTDIMAVLKDKRFLIAAGVVGVVGVFAFVRKSSATGTVGGGGITGASGGSGVQGSADTTGTDIASFLGNYSQSLGNQLSEYQKSLTDSLSSLPNVGVPVQPVGLNYGHTGVLTADSDLGALARMYWGDAPGGADLLRLANLDALQRSNGNLAGLNLVVPFNPAYKPKT